MRTIILWVIMVICQFSMFHIWWTKIYIYERKSNMTEIKLLRDLYAFWRYLCQQKHSEKVAEDKRKIYRFLFIIFIVMLIEIVMIFLVSIFAKIGIAVQIFFMGIMIGITYDVWKRGHKYLANFFDEYIEFLKKYQMIRSGTNKNIYDEVNCSEEESDGKKSILTNKMIILTIIILCLILICYGIRRVLKDIRYPATTGISFSIDSNMIEKIVFIAFVSIFGLAMLFDKILDKEKRQEFKKRYKERVKSMQINRKFKKIKDISICSELRQWESDILQMCECLHLKLVHINLCDNISSLAKVEKQKHGVFSIEISRLHYEDMHQYFKEDVFKNIFLFIIGHELAHSHFNDLSKRKMFFHCVSTGGCFLFYISTVLILFQKYYLLSLKNTLIVFFLTGYILFFMAVMSSPKYWGQVEELRADRVGMEVSGTMPDIFDAFASYCTYYLSGIDNAKDNAIYFFYSQYIEVEEHPELKRRSEELHRNKKWAITEYIRYCCIIQWKLLRRRGWKL